MKSLFLSLSLSLLTLTSQVIAGGGGCNGCPPPPPSKTIAQCEIVALNQLDPSELPQGTHHSFPSANKLFSSFKLGEKVLLKGGENHQKIFSIYYASVGAEKKYTDFNYYDYPKPVSLDPVEFPEIILNQTHTWTYTPEVFPTIGNSFLHLDKKPDQDEVSFKLVWKHEIGFIQHTKLEVLSGSLQCDWQ